MAVRDPPEAPLGAAGQERGALEVYGRGRRDGARWLRRPGLYPTPPRRAGAAVRGHVMRKGEPGRPRVGSAAAECAASEHAPAGLRRYITGPGAGGSGSAEAAGSCAPHRAPLLAVLRLSAPLRSVPHRSARTALRSAQRSARTEVSPDSSGPHCSARYRSAPRGPSLPRRPPEPRRPARPRQRAPLRRPRPPRRALPRAAGWPPSRPS